MKNLTLIISLILLLTVFGCRKSESNQGTLFYPNSFTPDGDGKNDYWSPYGIDILSDSYLMKIFNKKDKLLYETDDYKSWGWVGYDGWNGKVNGEVCLVDYYYYVVKYETLDGVKHKDTGMFQLIK